MHFNLNMEGKDTDSLLFVYQDARTEEGEMALLATALRLPGGTPNDVGWNVHNGWVMSEEPIEINWRFFMDTRRVAYHPSYRQPLLRRAVQQEIQIDPDYAPTIPPDQPLHLEMDRSLPKPPYYISAKRDLRPTVYTVIVRFAFVTLALLPQVRVALARKGWISEAEVEQLPEEPEDLDLSAQANGPGETVQTGAFASRFPWLFRLISGWKGTASHDYPDFGTEAYTTRFYPGLYVPVFLVPDETPGVLQIEQDLGQRTFRATLYMSDTLGHIPMPIALRCKKTVRDGDLFRVASERVIGNIVEILR